MMLQPGGCVMDSGGGNEAIMTTEPGETLTERRTICGKNQS